MPKRKPLPDNVVFIGMTATKSGAKKTQYLVTCLFCGKDRKITRHDHAVRLSKHQCKTCSNKNNNPQKEVNGVRVSWFNKYKISAKYRSLEWDIDINDIYLLFINQKGKCALSGIDISVSGDLSDITASIDRIDNKKGYLNTNIQLVHKKINMMRGSLPIIDFIFLCNSIYNNNKGKI